MDYVLVAGEDTGTCYEHYRGAIYVGLIKCLGTTVQITPVTRRQVIALHPKIQHLVVKIWSMTLNRIKWLIENRWMGGWMNLWAAQWRSDAAWVQIQLANNSSDTETSTCTTPQNPACAGKKKTNTLKQMPYHTTDRPVPLFVGYYS